MSAGLLPSFQDGTRLKKQTWQRLTPNTLVYCASFLFLRSLLFLTLQILGEGESDEMIQSRKWCLVLTD